MTRQSQRRLKTCLTEMAQARQQAVILGCTELVMLVDPGADVLPVYDTTALHAKAAVDWLLAPDGGVFSSEMDGTARLKRPPPRTDSYLAHFRYRAALLGESMRRSCVHVRVSGKIPTV